jgi:hypothetical protein
LALGKANRILSCTCPSWTPAAICYNSSAYSHAVTQNDSLFLG